MKENAPCLSHLGAVLYRKGHSALKVLPSGLPLALAVSPESRGVTVPSQGPSLRPRTAERPAALKETFGILLAFGDAP